MATWGEIKQEVSDEYDLAEETFINDQELLGYANEAIDDIEAEIHSIHDKYFESVDHLPLVAGSSEIARPIDMYANKVTAIWYNDGQTKYEIKPLKRLSDIAFVDSNDFYRYRMVNTTAGGTVIKLYPASREDSPTNITIYYLRQAKRFQSEDDVLDIPEGKMFLKQYIKDKAAYKERMTPDAPESAALKRCRDLLIQTLDSMAVDDNDIIEADLELYQDQVGE